MIVAETSRAFRLRPVMPADRDFLLKVYASTREEELALVTWDAGQKSAFIEMQFGAQCRHYLEHFPEAEHSIIERGGEPIGRLYVERRAQEIRVLDLALLPAHRGAGLGSAVLAELLAEGRRSTRPVRLHVETFNRARRLYERFGFVAAGGSGVHLELEWLPAPQLPAAC